MFYNNEDIDSMPSDTTEKIWIKNTMTNVSDLRRFQNLVTLYCAGSGLSSLPLLPQGLVYFSCCNNEISSLPELPPNLLALRCTKNKLTLLPQLPSTLSSLDCSLNKITFLPDLPGFLKVLTCNVCELSLLPDLPESLQHLACDDNHLTTLPKLPENLHIFSCNKNALTSLPTLPNNLIQIRFESNHLTSLPDLSKLKLPTYLYCSNNPIVEFLGLHDNEVNGFITRESNIISHIQKKVDTLNNFRVMYYALKCKQPLRKLLWEKIREPRIMQHFHPDNLEMLSQEDDVFHVDSTCEVENCNIKFVIKRLEYAF